MLFFLTGTDERSVTFIVESIGVYETQKRCEQYLLRPQTSLFPVKYLI